VCINEIRIIVEKHLHTDTRVMDHVEALTITKYLCIRYISNIFLFHIADLTKTTQGNVKYTPYSANMYRQWILRANLERSQSRQTIKYGQGLGTKNHCADEGQQQCSSQSGATNVAPT
jgi:hypothetical protein